jgi:hypothetical protein
MISKHYILKIEAEKISKMKEDEKTVLIKSCPFDSRRSQSNGRCNALAPTRN